jgi:negative regulator of flagellin synthesis FlgM
MQVYGSTYLHGAQALSAPHTSRAPAASASTGSNSVSDQLEISTAGQFADRLSQIPDIRQDRVSQIKAAIANGTYETDDKLSTALSRMLDEIA